MKPSPFQPPAHTNETRVYQMPIVIPGVMQWVGELGDVRVEGFTEDDARMKLGTRLGELRRELESTARLVRR